jgi:hypothetical protein
MSETTAGVLAYCAHAGYMLSQKLPCLILGEQSRGSPSLSQKLSCLTYGCSPALSP